MANPACERCTNQPECGGCGRHLRCGLCDPETKILDAVLSRPPADVSDAELECALRLAWPGCGAVVAPESYEETKG